MVIPESRGASRSDAQAEAKTETKKTWVRETGGFFTALRRRDWDFWDVSATSGQFTINKKRDENIIFELGSLGAVSLKTIRNWVTLRSTGKPIKSYPKVKKVKVGRLIGYRGGYYRRLGKKLTCHLETTLRDSRRHYTIIAKTSCGRFKRLLPDIKKSVDSFRPKRRSKKRRSR